MHFGCDEDSWRIILSNLDLFTIFIILPLVSKSFNHFIQNEPYYKNIKAIALDFKNNKQKKYYKKTQKNFYESLSNNPLHHRIYHELFKKIFFVYKSNDNLTHNNNLDLTPQTAIVTRQKINLDKIHLFPNTERLMMYNLEYTNFANIIHLKSLTTLNVSDSNFNDNDLTLLQLLPKLKHIVMNSCTHITDLTPLKNCLHLENINASYCYCIIDTSFLSYFNSIEANFIGSSNIDIDILSRSVCYMTKFFIIIPNGRTFKRTKRKTFL